MTDGVNRFWLQAAKSLRPMQLDVAVPDCRVVNVNVDSASTSSEICEMIASNLNIKDSFGFSLHITVDQKVRVRGILRLCFLRSCNWVSMSIKCESKNPPPPERFLTLIRND